jgi:hypothetical protein
MSSSRAWARPAAFGHALGEAPGEHGISPYTQKLIMPEKRQNSGHLNTEAKGSFGSGKNKTRSESTDGRKD